MAANAIDHMEGTMNNQTDGINDLTFRQPLSLTVYPPCNCQLDSEPHYTGEYGVSFWKAAHLAQQKRFTDAELAAEYWRAEYRAAALETMGYEAEEEHAENQSAVLWHFATTRSYDEADE